MHGWLSREFIEPDFIWIPQEQYGILPDPTPLARSRSSFRVTKKGSRRRAQFSALVTYSCVQVQLLSAKKTSFVIHADGCSPKLLQMRVRLCKRTCSWWLSLTVDLLLFGEMYRAFHERLLSVPASSGLLLTNTSLDMSRAYFMEPI